MIELVLEAERAMSFGLLDQAERLYRQAADADPRNAMAVVGLARVAIERGDEEAALRLGERALAIDPDNQAARRLVDRLREISDHRAGQAPAGAAPDRTPEPAVRGAIPEPATAAGAARPAEVSEPPPTAEPIESEREPQPAGGPTEPAGGPAEPAPEAPPPEPEPAAPPRARLSFLRRLFGRR